MGIEQEPDDEQIEAVEIALAVIRGIKDPLPTFETTLEDDPAGLAAKLGYGFLDVYQYSPETPKVEEVNVDIEKEADKFLVALSSYKSRAQLRIEPQIVNQITIGSIYRRALEIQQTYINDFIKPDIEKSKKGTEIGKILNHWGLILQIIDKAMHIEKSRQEELAPAKPADDLPQGSELTSLIESLDEELRGRTRDRTTPVRKPPEQIRLEGEVRGFIADFLERESVKSNTLVLAKLFKSNFEGWARGTSLDFGKPTLMRAKLVILDVHNDYLRKALQADTFDDGHKKDWFLKIAEKWWGMLEVVDAAINLGT